MTYDTQCALLTCAETLADRERCTLIC